MTKQSRNMVWLVIVMLCAVVVWTAPETPAGDRLVVHVLEPFKVSDEVFPAGKLSLKEVRALSPIDTLHEIRVDGVSHGLLVVRESDRPSVATNDEFGFTRASDGHLVLESLALAGQPEGTVQTYPSETARSVEVASKSGFLP